jgi:hypothetical protein
MLNVYGISNGNLLLTKERLPSDNLSSFSLKDSVCATPTSLVIFEPSFLHGCRFRTVSAEISDITHGKDKIMSVLI